MILNEVITEGPGSTIEFNYGDMIALGIIDPTKVTRSALQHAASVASMLITAGMITNLPEENQKTMLVPQAALTACWYAGYGDDVSHCMPNERACLCRLFFKGKPGVD